MATQGSDVINSFHSSFSDKTEIPDALENMWLKKAIGEFSVEIAPLEYNEDLNEFTADLDRYVIDILAKMMKVYYCEREYSRVNKIVSIVGKDLSINGQGNLSKYTEDELSKSKSDLIEMLGNLMPSAYS